jgi:hypothetical protein
MKTNQLKISAGSIESSLKAKNLSLMLAFGTIATGAVAMMSAAPASAALLQTGEFGFTDGTLDFFNINTFAIGNPLSVTFDPTPANARISSATGDFDPIFDEGSIYSVSTATGNFAFVSGNRYRLTNDLPFAFTNQGVTITVNAGSLFDVITNNASQGLTLAAFGATGKITNADGTVATQQLAFSFNDLPNTPGRGNYGILVSPTAVPEPFTIIGTIVGGTAALRLRKKLTQAANK